MSTDAQINNLLLNGKVAAAAACVCEKLKGGHNHLEETEIGTRIAERDSKSVSELELERSPPGLLDAASAWSDRRVHRHAPPPDACVGGRGEGGGRPRAEGTDARAGQGDAVRHDAA